MPAAPDPASRRTSSSFILWLVPTIEKFPRSQKFLLGVRIQTTVLDVLESLIEATYTRDRFARVNLGLEKLRVFCRRIATTRPAVRKFPLFIEAALGNHGKSRRPIGPVWVTTCQSRHHRIASAMPPKPDRTLYRMRLL